jgi:hypothetical protein
MIGGGLPRPGPEDVRAGVVLMATCIGCLPANQLTPQRTQFTPYSGCGAHNTRNMPAQPPENQTENHASYVLH